MRVGVYTCIYGRAYVCVSVHLIKGNFSKSTDAATQRCAFYYYYKHFIEKTYTQNAAATVAANADATDTTAKQRICEKKAKKKTIFIQTHTYTHNGKDKSCCANFWAMAVSYVKRFALLLFQFPLRFCNRHFFYGQPARRLPESESGCI